MKNISDMISDIITREKAFENRPLDEGGPLRFGISQQALSNYLGRIATKEEFESLTQSTARQVFEYNHLVKTGIESLPGDIQPYLVDCSASHGGSRAIKLLQNVCNQAGYQAQLIADGIVGVKTRDAANWAAKKLGKDFICALFEERNAFYQKIIRSRPSQTFMVQQWISRNQALTTALA